MEDGSGPQQISLSPPPSHERVYQLTDTFFPTSHLLTGGDSQAIITFRPPPLLRSVNAFSDPLRLLRLTLFFRLALERRPRL